jgi:hypothetical protein
MVKVALRREMQLKKAAKILITIGSVLGAVLFVMNYRSSLPQNNQIEPDDYFTLVNKWHYDLMDDDYKLFTIIMSSTLLDPELEVVDASISYAGDNPLYDIEKWAEKNIVNSHQLEAFEDLPGGNPWGETDKPVYKHLLPSEMKAMGLYADTYAGDCKSISHLMLGLLRRHGISEDDIFVVRTRLHCAVIAQYDRKVYLVDGTDVETLNWLELFFYNIFRVTGFYNDQFYTQGRLLLTEDKLKGDGSLRERLETNYGLVFKDIRNEFQEEQLDELRDLALQRNDLEAIARASLLGPNVRALAHRVVEISDLVTWMNENLDGKSIFGESSIMTADQVIVFKTGDSLDRSLLMMSVIHSLGSDSKLYSRDDSYLVEHDGSYYLFDQTGVRAVDIEPDAYTYLLNLDFRSAEPPASKPWLLLIGLLVPSIAIVWLDGHVRRRIE